MMAPLTLTQYNLLAEIVFKKKKRLVLSGSEMCPLGRKFIRRIHLCNAPITFVRLLSLVMSLCLRLPTYE